MDGLGDEWPKVCWVTLGVALLRFSSELYWQVYCLISVHSTIVAAKLLLNMKPALF